jgi:hypothetical protein
MTSEMSGWLDESTGKLVDVLDFSASLSSTMIPPSSRRGSS